MLQIIPVWNFDAAYKYKFDVILMRAGAKIIVGKCAPIFEHCQSYLAQALRPMSDTSPALKPASPPAVPVETGIALSGQPGRVER